MKSMLCLLTFFSIFSASAKTENLTCSFTEPFYTIEISFDQKTVTTQNPDFGIKIYKNVEFLDHGYQQRVVFGTHRRNITVIQWVKDGQGSNGMSDHVFPYSAQMWTGLSSVQHGGCETPSEPAKLPIN